MKCNLCQNEPLQEKSHIVPAFIFRWLKSSSTTGYLRKPDNVNKRVNDGAKIQLLGPKCEDRFSIWEKWFAEKIFHPVHEQSQRDLEFQYDEKLANFCVSISWRVLIHKISNGYESLPYNYRDLIQPVLNVWRDYLCGNREDISVYSQHFIILDPNKLLGLKALDYQELSFYINRGIDYDIIYSDKEFYVMSKLCNILIIGSIQEPPNIWRNTEVSLNGGYYSQNDRQLSSLATTFFETGVDFLQKGRSSLSKKQSTKINEAYKRKNQNRKSQ